MQPSQTYSPVLSRPRTRPLFPHWGQQIGLGFSLTVTEHRLDILFVCVIYHRTVTPSTWNIHNIALATQNKRRRSPLGETAPTMDTALARVLGLFQWF